MSEGRIHKAICNSYKLTYARCLPLIFDCPTESAFCCIITQSLFGACTSKHPPNHSSFPQWGWGEPSKQPLLPFQAKMIQQTNHLYTHTHARASVIQRISWLIDTRSAVCFEWIIIQCQIKPNAHPKQTAQMEGAISSTQEHHLEHDKLDILLANAYRQKNYVN